MKNRIKFLAISLLIGYYANAQTLPFTPDEIKRMMDTLMYSSKHIFVGRYVSSTPYYAAANGDAIYTSNSVEVKCVLKGDLNPGTVEIINDGGTIGDNVVTVWDIMNIPSEYFLFYGNDVEDEAKPATFTNDNNRGVRMFDMVGIDGPDILNPSKGSGNLFTKTQDMFDYLQLMYGFVNTYSFGAKMQNPNNQIPTGMIEPPKVTGNANFDYKQNLANYEKYMQQLSVKQSQPENSNTANKGAAVTALNNTSLTLSLANQFESGTSPRFYEFDIMVSANTSGTYLDNCLTFLKYNVAAFSTSIATNNKITVTRGSLFNNTGYVNPQTLVNDQTSSTVTIPFGAANVSPMNRALVPTTPVVMLHVKIEIAYCNNFAMIDFTDKYLAYGLNWWQPAATTAYTAFSNVYDTTYFGAGLSPKLCAVNITDFTQPIHAGIGDILTIKGTNFGNTKGTGKVQFDNADGGPAINDLNAMDYISWSDTEIKIRLPHKVDSTIAKSAPGGGPFEVYNSLGGSGVSTVNQSNQPFEVYYSIINDDRVINGALVKHKINLKNDNGSGGYTIRLNGGDFPTGSIQRGCIIKAIKDWRCLTGSNIVIGADTNLSYVQGTSDGVNFVFMRSTGWAVGEGGRTVNGSNVCQTGTNQYHAFQQEFDMFFNSTFPWFYDTTGAALPTGQFDFYATALHEIGHALQVGHTCNSTSELMYWASINPVVRKTLQIYTGAADGGQFSVLNSVSAMPTNTCGNTVHVPQNSFCNFVGIDELTKGIFDFKVYPNPVTDNQITISYVLSQSANISFRLLNVTGQEILYYKPQNENMGYHQDEMKLPALPSGVYFLITSFKGGSNAVKIIKQ